MAGVQGCSSANGAAGCSTGKGWQACGCPSCADTISEVDTTLSGVTVDTSSHDLNPGGSPFMANFPPAINSEDGWATTPGSIFSISSSFDTCALYGQQYENNEGAQILSLVVPSGSGNGSGSLVFAIFTASTIRLVIIAFATTSGTFLPRGLIIFDGTAPQSDCCESMTIPNRFVVGDLGSIVPAFGQATLAGLTDYMVAGYGGSMDVVVICPDAP